MMLGYARGGYLKTKTTPSPVLDDDEDGRYAKSCRFGRRSQTTANKRMDESCKRPRRAVAEAIAHSLGIHPSINRPLGSLLQIGKLLGNAAVELCPPFGSIGMSRPRTKMMP
jgi:hypothetical protein